LAQIDSGAARLNRNRNRSFLEYDLRDYDRTSRKRNLDMTDGTLRLTTAQAIVKFLQVQYSERDGERRRFIPAMFGIFGHGNVHSLG
jgi:hypothetical protein